jgi:hypothetical protein
MKQKSNFLFFVDRTLTQTPSIHVSTVDSLCLQAKLVGNFPILIKKLVEVHGKRQLPFIRLVSELVCPWLTTETEHYAIRRGSSGTEGSTEPAAWSYYGRCWLPSVSMTKLMRWQENYYGV